MQRFPAVTRDNRPEAGRRVLSNTFYLLLADIANKLLALGFFIISARHLGVESFGILSFAIAYVTTAGVLADFGLALYVTREVARRPSEAGYLVGRAITIRFVAALLIGVLVALSVFVTGISGQARNVVAICSGLVMANGIFLLIAGVFQGFEQNIYTVFARAVQTGLLLLGALVLIRLTPDVVLFTWLFVGAAAASAIAAYALMIVRVVRPVFKIELHALLVMLRSALPMGVSAILVTAYYWNGSALLAGIAGEEATGAFAASHRLVLGLAVLGTAFSGAMYPYMARLQLVERERLTGVLGRALRYISFTAVPVAVLGIALASEAIGVVYGNAYAESIPVLRVLVLWACGTFYNSLLSNYYYSINRARYATIQAGISLTVNIAVNLLLIPRFGALGAAMALVAAEFAGTIWLLAGVISGWSSADLRGLVSGIIRCTGAALVAVILGRTAALVNAPVALAIGVLGYLLFALIFRAVSRTDIILLRGLFSK